MNIPTGNELMMNIAPTIGEILAVKDTEIESLRQRITELEPFKAASVQQVELHNKTLVAVSVTGFALILSWPWYMTVRLVVAVSTT